MNIEFVSSQPAVPAPAFESRSQTQDQISYERQLRVAVNAVNQAEFYGPRSQLALSIDQQTRRPLLQVIDRPTQEVLLQVPPEYVLEIARDLRSKAAETAY